MHITLISAEARKLLNAALTAALLYFIIFLPSGYKVG